MTNFYHETLAATVSFLIRQRAVSGGIIIEVRSTEGAEKIMLDKYEHGNDLLTDLTDGGMVTSIVQG